LAIIVVQAVNEGKYSPLYNSKVDSRHYGNLLLVEEKEK
jgi:hypothetical protein